MKDKTVNRTISRFWPRRQNVTCTLNILTVCVTNLEAAYFTLCQSAALYVTAFCNWLSTELFNELNSYSHTGVCTYPRTSPVIQPASDINRDKSTCIQQTNCRTHNDIHWQMLHLPTFWTPLYHKPRPINGNKQHKATEKISNYLSSGFKI